MRTSEFQHPLLLSVMVNDPENLRFEWRVANESYFTMPISAILSNRKITSGKLSRVEFMLALGIDTAKIAS